jgi:NTP pyrophosphatase (non-canonical NTP hydrolase)
MDNSWDADVTFEQLRDMLRQFADERNWEQFHLPKSLCLALNGEVGELCETMQWSPEVEKGLPSFTADKKRHVGEECSDVLAYLTRMCDRCNVDLGKAVTDFIHSPVLTFEDCRQRVQIVEHTYAREGAGPRDLCLALVAAAGEVAAMFARQPSKCKPGLADWHEADVLSLARGCARILMTLVAVAAECGINLPQAMLSKVATNARKYPVEKARNNAAKYTEL